MDECKNNIFSSTQFTLILLYLIKWGLGVTTCSPLKAGSVQELQCRVTDSVLGWKPYNTEFYDVHVLLALSDGHLINVFCLKIFLL